MSAPILDGAALADLIARRVVDELEARAKRREPILLTPEQMAARLKVSGKTLANMRSLGRGPAFVKVGSRVRYPVDPPEVQS